MVLILFPHTHTPRTRSSGVSTSTASSSSFEIRWGGGMLLIVMDMSLSSSLQAIVCGVSQQLDPVAASVIKTMLTLSCSSANPTTMKTGNTRDVRGGRILGIKGLRCKEGGELTSIIISQSLLLIINPNFPSQIFTHEIADALDRPKLSRNELEQYLRVLTDQQVYST